MLDGVSRFIGRTFLAAFVALSAAVGSAAHADDDDHVQAPRNVAPLENALAAVQSAHPGRVLKVELDREDHAPVVWVYEVKVLTDAGHVLEIELDAVSLEIIDVEGARSRRSDED